MKAVHLVLAAVLVACAGLPATVLAAEGPLAALVDVRMSADRTTTRIVFDLDGPPRYDIFELQEPDRLVVDLQGARAQNRLQIHTHPHSLVERVRHAPRQNSDLRVVLDLREPVRQRSFVLRPESGTRHRLVLDLTAHPRVPMPAVQIVGPAPTRAPAPEASHGSGLAAGQPDPDSPLAARAAPAQKAPLPLASDREIAASEPARLAASDAPSGGDERGWIRVENQLTAEAQLHQKLEAERALNRQLRELLQAQEAGRCPPGNPSCGARPALVAWHAEPEMARATESLESRRAIEEALVSRDLVLLPKGAYRITPALSWVHDGSGASRRDSYITSAQLQAGLPHGFAASVRVPYVWRDYAVGSNDGIGDVTLGLRRKLTNEGASMPSLIARLDYTHDTGANAFSAVPISSGFRSIEAGLSAVKRFDPIVISGSGAYSHAFEQSGVSIERNGVPVFRGGIQRGDAVTLGLGASLAATPDITLETGLNYSFQEGTRFASEGGPARRGSSTTAGYLSLGAGMVLSKDLYLSFSAAAGITDDAADSIFSVSMPYRF